MVTLRRRRRRHDEGAADDSAAAGSSVDAAGVDASVVGAASSVGFSVSVSVLSEPLSEESLLSLLPEEPLLLEPVLVDGVDAKSRRAGPSPLNDHPLL